MSDAVLFKDDDDSKLLFNNDLSIINVSLLSIDMRLCCVELFNFNNNDDDEAELTDVDACNKCAASLLLLLIL